MLTTLTKRDRLLTYVKSKGERTYTPAAFFLHFVKIQFEIDFPTHEVKSPTDYKSISPLSPTIFDKQFRVVKSLLDSMKREAVVVLTLYSPFMVLGRMVGAEKLNAHLEEDPSAVAPAIEKVADELLEFVKECEVLGIDGFYHATQGGESRRFKNPETFTKYIKPTDLHIMKVTDRICPFNILHICDYHKDFGNYSDLQPFLDYPGTVVNVSTEIGDRHLTPTELSDYFGRPFMGGLDRLGPIATGTPDEARAAAKEVLSGAPPRFILGADCTVAAETPWENLHAAVDEAHHFSG